MSQTTLDTREKTSKLQQNYLAKDNGIQISLTNGDDYLSATKTRRLAMILTYIMITCLVV